MSIASVKKEDRIVFTSDDTSYSVRDVIDAAHFRGEVQPLWDKFCASVEAQRSAEQASAEVDEEAIDAAATEFRYSHDLISAEETERWLEERALALDDFDDHFVRRFWAATRTTASSSPPLPFEEAGVDLR